MVPRPKKPFRKSSVRNHRSTLSLQKTEVLISVYDLLPVHLSDASESYQPGRLSSILWTFGSSLLHSGVVVNDKEYAYGGHDQPGKTGVYWTRPRQEPPGATFRSEVLHGFTIRTEEELETIIKEVSSEYLGQSYNLLKKNCNHFTNTLCQRLTSRSAPSWLNRAANIGIALPCIVPPEWLEPPDYDTAGGALLADADGNDERAGTLISNKRRQLRQSSSQIGGGSEHPSASLDDWETDEDQRNRGRAKSRARIRDTSGRIIPASDRAPTAIAGH
ncbi:MAG: hypothetical protein M1837_004146 [Sclerophora amabilis]|nr:MAG: hypothetical protein M1837_004146 [Sclerophora amabilis]